MNNGELYVCNIYTPYIPKECNLNFKYIHISFDKFL